MTRVGETCLEADVSLLLLAHEIPRVVEEPPLRLSGDLLAVPAHVDGEGAVGHEIREDELCGAKAGRFSRGRSHGKLNRREMRDEGAAGTKKGGQKICLRCESLL